MAHKTKREREKERERRKQDVKQRRAAAHLSACMDIPLWPLFKYETRAVPDAIPEYLEGASPTLLSRVALLVDGGLISVTRYDIWCEGVVRAGFFGGVVYPPRGPREPQWRRMRRPTDAELAPLIANLEEYNLRELTCVNKQLRSFVEIHDLSREAAIKDAMADALCVRDCSQELVPDPVADALLPDVSEFRDFSGPNTREHAATMAELGISVRAYLCLVSPDEALTVVEHRGRAGGIFMDVYVDPNPETETACRRPTNAECRLALRVFEGCRFNERRSSSVGGSLVRLFANAPGAWLLDEVVQSDRECSARKESENPADANAAADAADVNLGGPARPYVRGR